MFEIRLGNELMTFRGSLHDALIETIDVLRGSSEPSLAETYRKYKSYDDEDLIEEIEELAPDKFLDIRINIRLDQKIRATTQLLD